MATSGRSRCMKSKARKRKKKLPELMFVSEAAKLLPRDRRQHRNGSRIINRWISVGLLNAIYPTTSDPKKVPNKWRKVRSADVIELVKWRKP